MEGAAYLVRKKTTMTEIAVMPISLSRSLQVSEME